MTTHVYNDAGNDISPIGSGRRGLPKAWRRVRRDGQFVLILCYHGVSQVDEHVWDPRLYIHADAFRTRLQAVQDFSYQVLPLHEAFDRLTENSLSGPTAEIGEIAAGGIDVQLHTHRHRLPVDRQLFFRELDEKRHG